MKTHLAEELAKYFTRLGNRIVFTNGRTLNQFAFDMWEDPNSQSIDPSVLSRVLSGERLFTTRQLVTFCKLLGLSASESNELKLNLLQDFAERYSDWPQGEGIGPSASTLDLYEYLVAKVEQDRFTKPWEYLYDLACELDWQLHQLNHQLAKTSLAGRFLNVYAANCINVAFVAPSALPRWGQDIRQRLSRHSSVLKMASVAVNNRFYSEFSKVIWHPFYYYNYDYLQAEKLVRSIKFTVAENPLWFVDINHTLVVSLGGQLKLAELEAFGQRLTGRRSQFQGDDRVKLLLATAKAYHIAQDQESANRYLDKTWNGYYASANSGDFSTTRYAQLIATTLRFKIENNQKLNFADESLGKAGLAAAKKVGHRKHYQEIDKYLRINP